MRSRSHSSDVGARCPAAGSIRQALNRAIEVVEREFPRKEEGSRHVTTCKGVDCSALRAELSSRKATLLAGRSESVTRTMTQMLKSLDRFFDIPCPPCDKVAVSRARSLWQRDVATPVTFDPATPASWSEEPLSELARRVSRLVGTDWAKGIKECRDACLVPDQRGCLETPSGEGGTLATAHYSEDVYGLRVGTAKTKGKIRVVTMQSAKVKSVLRPVHDCLYDFLSRRKWLVRGELSKEHIQSVLMDREDGEDFVSGDYKAATNNIYLPAVETIVRVLAEAPSLSEEERTILLGSFASENLHWVSMNGVSHPILRGSMMGNLVSFPVLCLLNKACFDIVSSLRRKRTGVKRYRRPIINGDDIAFAGDRQTYDDWVMVTGHFGLVVNEEKTGFSSRFIELNSRSYDVERRGFLRKPVLSALLPGDDPSCLLSRLWEGLKTLSPGVLRYVIVMMRHHIQRRGVCLSGIPARMRRVLLKDRWFRAAVQVEPQVVSSGVKRCWPVVTRDFRPPPSHLRLYERMQRALLRLGVKLCRGVRVRPWECRLKKGRRPEVSSFGRLRLVTRWRWRWSAPLLNYWEACNLPVVELSQGQWEEDHPDLFSETVAEIESLRFPPPFALMLDAVRPDGVNWI